MARSVTVPARIAWAVELLRVQPDDRILEVGSGPGVAAGLVASQLGPTGRLTAIDRSRTAVDRVVARHPELLASGRLVLHHVELARLDGVLAGDDGSGGGEPFHKALAVNVNLFWTTAARVECAVLHRLLVPGGDVFLVYGGAGPGERRDIAPGIAAKLERAGFGPRIAAGPDGRSVCVIGRRLD